MTSQVVLHYVRCGHEISGYHAMNVGSLSSPSEENVVEHTYLDKTCDDCDEPPPPEEADQKPVRRSKFGWLRAVFRGRRSRDSSRSGTGSGSGSG